MQNVSGFGLGITLLALQSFPMGFPLSQFADDVAPIEVFPTEAVGYEMLYDNTLFAFDKAAPVRLAVSVIPDTSDDINLKILLQARKATSSLIPLPDITSIVISYSNGGIVMLTNGTILSGPLADTIIPTGRKRGNTYNFVFGTFSGVQNTSELISSVAQAALGLF